MDDVAWETLLTIDEIPARRFWDATFLAEHAPERIVADDRPGADPSSFMWAGNVTEAGQFLHGYYSAWLPASLLGDDRIEALAEAVVAGSRHWGISLNFNKGLAGAPAADLAAARDTATNPVVVDAFALAVVIAEGPPAHPEIPGREIDLTAARADVAAVRRAGDELARLVPRAGSYVSESDYFIRDWQEAFWGTNYPRLAEVKRTYDPTGLFFVHHGVGSEEWDTDGFTARSDLRARRA